MRGARNARARPMAVTSFCLGDLRPRHKQQWCRKRTLFAGMVNIICVLLIRLPRYCITPYDACSAASDVLSGGGGGTRVAGIKDYEQKQ